MSAPCCTVNALGRGHSTSCRQWQPRLCAIESCRRPISRWSAWRNRNRPSRQRFCGPCNRAWTRAWNAWTGGYR